MLKLYLDHLRRAFTKWKRTHDNNKVETKTMVMEEFQEENASLSNQVSEMKKDVKERKEKVDRSSKTRLHKCALSYRRRMKQIAMGRWRDRMGDEIVKENGADAIIKRMRKRFMRHAFDLYLEGVKYKMQLQKDEARCQFYKQTLAERLKKKCFGNWAFYSNKFHKAKSFWLKLFNHLEHSRERAAFVRWRDYKQRHIENELRIKQIDHTSNLVDLNHQMGELTEQNEA